MPSGRPLHQCAATPDKNQRNGRQVSDENDVGGKPRHRAEA